MQHHAFVVEAPAEEGIVLVSQHIQEILGMTLSGNPDVVTLRYDLFSIEDARYVNELASQGGFLSDTKAIVINTNRIYHEAQNALLKLFEEPPRETYIFLILPNLGALLPTLRSRVQILEGGSVLKTQSDIPENVVTFIRATKEQRTSMIKNIAASTTEGTGAGRDDAVSLINGIERLAYSRFQQTHTRTTLILLRDIAVLRSFLYERSAPIRMILEHIGLSIPKNLL